MSSSDNDLLEPLERMKAFWAKLNKTSEGETADWNGPLYECLTPIGVHMGPSWQTNHPPKNTCTVFYLLTVTDTLCNRTGSLHGGAAATVFDVCTSLSVAPLSKDDFWAGVGVSRTLNVTFLRPVQKGMRVVVAAEVVNLGGRLGHVRGWMRQLSKTYADNLQGQGKDLKGLPENLTDLELCEGPVLLTVEHGKVNADPPPDKENIPRRKKDWKL